MAFFNKMIGFKECSLFLTLLYGFFGWTATYGQSATMTTSGNWDNTANWSGANIGDDITETVIWNNNVNPTIRNGFNYTVGNVVGGNGNSFTINGGGTLNIGNSSNPKNLTTNNNAVINVTGTLIVWGNLVVNNTLTWNIAAGGVVIIKGSVDLGNNGSINVAGNIQIDGNLTGGNGTAIDVSGSVSIGGNINVGNGSTLTGCGSCVHVSGGCSGPSGFCGSGTLPITLLYFNANPNQNAVQLDWATVSEENFDSFIIERTSDGKNFEDLGTVKSKADKTSNVKTEYGFEDSWPVTGDSYYRLKALDHDGTFDYFGPLHVKIALEKKLSIYPNPVVGSQLNISLNYDPASNGYAVVMDLYGNILASTPLTGSNTALFLPSGFKQGYYVLKVVSGEDKMLARFLVN